MLTIDWKPTGGRRQPLRGGYFSWYFPFPRYWFPPEWVLLKRFAYKFHRFEANFLIMLSTDTIIGSLKAGKNF